MSARTLYVLGAVLCTELAVCAWMLGAPGLAQVAAFMVAVHLAMACTHDRKPRQPRQLRKPEWGTPERTEGRWGMYADGRLMCMQHPTADIPNEAAAATHMAEQHGDLWDTITTPGAVTPVRNRGERREAERYAKRHMRPRHRPGGAR